MDWLRSLLKEVNGVVLDGQLGSEIKLEDGETVVGELPEELRKFFVVFTNRRTALAKGCESIHQQLLEILARQMLFGKIKPEEQTLIDQHEEAHRENEMLQGIFWHVVRQAVPKARFAEVVGIVDGWKVATSKSREGESRPRFVGVEIVSRGGMPSLADLLGLAR